MTTHLNELRPNNACAEVGLQADQRGAIMIAGVFMCGIVCAFLWFIIGIGNAILYRESLQDSADALAFTGAVLHAHGMMIIVLLNLIMTALVGILVVLRALETILFGLIVLCTVLNTNPFTAWIGAPCLAVATPALNATTQVANNLDTNILAKVLPKLNAAARGLSLVFPWIAEGKTIAHALRLRKKNVYNGGIESGLMVSESLIPKGKKFKVGLPIEEDNQTFHGKTEALAKELFDATLPKFLSKLLSGVVAKGVDLLGFRAHLSRGRCDSYQNTCGDTPLKKEIPPFKFDPSMFDKDIAEACGEKSKECTKKGDTYEQKEAIDEKDSSKGTRLVTAEKSEMDDCSADVRSPKVDLRCEQDGRTNTTCPTVPDGVGGRKPNPHHNEHYKPAHIYECWEDGVQCAIYDSNSNRYTDEEGNITDQHGLAIEKLKVWKFDFKSCEKREKAKVKKQLDEKSKEDSATDSGNTDQCEGPKKLFCGIEHAGDQYFAVYAIAAGKSPELNAHAGVRVAAPNERDEGLGPLELASRLGTAQAEFYFAGGGWADQAMWNFKWQARLRFFHLPQKWEEKLGKAGDAASKLEGLGNGIALIEDRIAYTVHCTRSCFTESVDSQCLQDCMAIELELPINRFQSIH